MRAARRRNRERHKIRTKTIALGGCSLFLFFLSAREGHLSFLYISRECDFGLFWQCLISSLVQERTQWLRKKR